MVWNRPHRQLEKENKWCGSARAAGATHFLPGERLGLVRAWERDRDQEAWGDLQTVRSVCPGLALGCFRRVRREGWGSWEAEGRKGPWTQSSTEGCQEPQCLLRGAQRWLSGCGQSWRGLWIELEWSTRICKPGLPPSVTVGSLAQWPKTNREWMSLLAKVTVHGSFITNWHRAFPLLLAPQRNGKGRGEESEIAKRDKENSSSELTLRVDSRLSYLPSTEMGAKWSLICKFCI